jgi:hypothetical protein
VAKHFNFELFNQWLDTPWATLAAKVIIFLIITIVSNF